jgi:hypothetical protein
MRRFKHRGFKSQLQEVSIKPLSYIPLSELFANNGDKNDETRLDYLLSCLNANPEYKQQRAKENHIWREKTSAFLRESYETIREFIPGDIFKKSINDLGTPCHLASAY